MRKLVLAAALAALSVGSFAGAASATDVCLRPLTAKGNSHPDYFTAMALAMKSWEYGVARRDGRRFADWNYSIERGVTCTWRGDARDAIYTCTATAQPCARAY